MHYPKFSLFLLGAVLRLDLCFKKKVFNTLNFAISPEFVPEHNEDYCCEANCFEQARNGLKIH